MKLFENSTNISESQIDELFKKKKDTEMDLILKTLSVIIYQNSISTDIMEMYRLLGADKFSQLILLLDGRPTRLPSATEFKEALVLSLIYYYKEVQNLPWNEIKKKFPFEISGISYGIKVKQLSNYIKQKLGEYLEQLNKLDEGNKNE